MQVLSPMVPVALTVLNTLSLEMTRCPIVSSALSFFSVALCFDVFGMKMVVVPGATPGFDSHVTGAIFNRVTSLIRATI
jgi:hypothetical protein